MKDTLVMIASIVVFFIVLLLLNYLYGTYDNNTELNSIGILLPFILAFIPSYYIGKKIEEGYFPESVIFVAPIALIVAVSGYIYFRFSLSELYRNEWILLYTIGVIAASLATTINFIWSRVLMHLKGEVIMWKNFDKLFLTKKAEVEWLKLLAFSMVCWLSSWLWVLVELVSFTKAIFTVLKGIIATKPEKLKEVQFPLFNNSNLTVEKAWAHFTAQSILLGNLSAGDQLSSELKEGLFEAELLHEGFDKAQALDHLSELDVVSNKVLEVLNKITA